MKYIVLIFMSGIFSIAAENALPQNAPKQSTLLESCWEGSKNGLYNAGHFTCSVVISTVVTSVINTLLKKYVCEEKSSETIAPLAQFTRAFDAPKDLHEIKERISFFKNQHNLCSEFHDDTEAACKKLMESLLARAQKEYMQTIFHPVEIPDNFMESCIAATDWHQVCTHQPRSFGVSVNY